MLEGLPGPPNVVYAEWTQETIEPNRISNLPDTDRGGNAEMLPMFTWLWCKEFYELVAPEKLKIRTEPIKNHK